MTAPAKARPPLTRAQAMELTFQIKRSVERTWEQLCEAYERRAWEALGFTSWEVYVRDELDISRSRSYQLLDQGTVVREIRAAAGVHTVDVNEATARDIKPHLTAVTDQVREAVVDVPVEDRPVVVAQVVRDVREQVLADKRTGEVVPAEEWVAANATPAVDDTAQEPAAAADDGWSPSGALDRRPSRPKSSPVKSTRPATIEQSFAEATAELRRAVDRVERLSADGRFAAHATKLNEKHRGGIDYALEGLNIVLIRLRPAGSAAAVAPDSPSLPADRRQGRGSGGGRG